MSQASLRVRFSVPPVVFRQDAPHLMRLWSVHPKYLDAKGLVALWREGLLARKVLQGKTTGYRHHPQLVRFREMPRPLEAIDAYLTQVWKEATARGYSFDVSKIRIRTTSRIPVQKGQLEYEWQHLLRKLRTRDPKRARGLRRTVRLDCHPLFRVVPGAIEPWERA